MAIADMEAGQILIFKNDKGDNPRRPDYRGELKTPEGKQYRFSLWLEQAKSGQKYMRGQVQDIEFQQQPEVVTETQSAPVQPPPETTDDIPF